MRRPHQDPGTIPNSPPPCAKSPANSAKPGWPWRAAKRTQRIPVMFNWIRPRVLHLIRVPHDPAPPYGAPGSVRIFRAGRHYFTMRMVGWGIAQLVALAAIIFWAVMLID